MFTKFRDHKVLIGLGSLLVALSIFSFFFQDDIKAGLGLTQSQDDVMSDEEIHQLHTQVAESAKKQNEDIKSKPSDLDIEELSHQMGRVSENPPATMSALAAMANRLEPHQIIELKTQALNTELNVDSRFMAIELIGLSPNHQIKIHALFEIASQPWSEGKNPSFDDYEKMLRAQAIEHLYGSKAEPQLVFISQQTHSRFLKDRALRSLAAIRGEAPAPDQQDRKALAELLKSNKLNKKR